MSGHDWISTEQLSCLNEQVAPLLNNQLYCKVFVETAVDREDMAQIIVGFAPDAMRERQFEIRTGEISIDVRRNKYLHSSKHRSFLDSKFYLDVNAFSGITLDRFLESLAKLVSYLKRNELTVVAACDWEDEVARLVENQSR